MAVSFNGTNALINMGTGSALNIANNAAMSLMCWVNFSNFTGTQTYLSKGYDGTKTAYQFQISPGTPPTLNWNSFDGATTHGNIMSTASLSTGTWYHIYGDYDPTGTAAWHLYVAGVLAITNNDVVGPASTTAKFQVGAVDANGSNMQWFTGCLADVALFNGPLTGTEITNLANGSLRPNAGMSKTLLGYWALDTAAASQTDLSGNGNTGTAAGGAVTDTCGTGPTFTGGTVISLMGATCIPGL